MALNVSKKTSPADVDSSAKGDLIVNSGTDIVSLPVGADGQVIIADAASPEGLKWTDDKPVVAEEALLDNSIVRTYAGTPNVTTDGANDLIRYFYDQNGASNANGVLFNVGTTVGGTDAGAVTNEIETGAGGNISITSGGITDIYLDLGAGNAVTCTAIGYIGFNQCQLRAYASTNGSSWVNLGNFTNNPTGSGHNRTNIISDPTPYRYFRWSRVSGNCSVYEINLFGTYTTATPLRELVPADLNKINYLSVGSAATYTLNIPNSTGQWTQGDYYRFVNQGTGKVEVTLGGSVNLAGQTTNLSNFMLVNLDGADNWLIVRDTPTTLLNNTKGSLIVGDGTENTELTVGTNGQVLLADSTTTEGLAWGVPGISAEEAAVDNSIVRSYAGGFPSTADDIIDYLFDQNGSANPNGVSIFVGETIGASDIPELTDQVLTGGHAPDGTVGDEVFFDLGAGNAIVFTDIVLLQQDFLNWDIHVSTNGTAWVFLGNVGAGGGFGNKTLVQNVTDVTPYRYVRLTTTEADPSALREVRFYGTYTTSNLNRTLVPADLNKVNYRNVGSGQTYTLNIPDSTGQWSAGDWFSFGNTGVGTVVVTVGGSVILNGHVDDLTNFSLYNIDGADQWLIVKDTFVTVDNKGGLLTSDGTDQVELGVGADGQVLLADSTESNGIKWGELGGLNLTETKYITTTTIDKTYPGSGDFNTNIPGVIDFIGTDEDTVAYSNVDTDDEVDFIVNGTLAAYPTLVDKDYATAGPSVTGTGFGIVVDLKRPAYIKPTHFGLGVQNGSRDYSFEGSNNGTDWDVLGTAVPPNGTTGSINAVSTENFYRYLRYQQTSGSTTVFYEIEVYGEIVPASPTYNIVDGDNNKFLLVPFGNATTINMPTGINDTGFVTQITPTVAGALPITINPLAGVTFIGQNFTIDNMGEVATIVQVTTDTYVVSISRGKLPLSAKGDILTHDGTEPVVQAVGSDDTVLTADSGEASGVAWKDINTIVATPFTSQRLDISSATQLTGSNARYLYVAASGGTQDIILTDPPSTNDFFYIVNRDGANDIQIKEIAAGGVVQILNSVTPVAQCHYDGTEWQIVTLGTV